MLHALYSKELPAFSPVWAATIPNLPKLAILVRARIAPTGNAGRMFDRSNLRHGYAAGKCVEAGKLVETFLVGDKRGITAADAAFA